jgi:transketolase
VEHLASLRAIPGLKVYRPADEAETAKAWAEALSYQGPSVLALTRQGLPTVTKDAEALSSSSGAYVLRDADDYQATIIATGSEVEIALAAADQLASEGIQVRVVSMNCAEDFLSAGGTHIAETLGTKPRLGIEAGIQMGWGELLALGGTRWDFLGMESFGASGPYKELYEHFGITAKNAAAKVRALIEGN